MKRLKPVLDAAPTVDLITLEEARAHVRRDDNDDDSYIESLIAVVMSHLDGASGGILGRALLSQTWIETADGFPVGDEFRFILAPVISVSSVKYYDADNVLQTFAAENYSVHNGREYSYLKLANTASWPSTYERDDALSITASFGYGATASEVPAVIKHAAKMLLGHWYENREAVLVGTVSSELPAGIMKLLRPYIRPHF